MAAKNKPYTLTPEQIALSEERKARKLKAVVTQESDSLNSHAGAILNRQWISTSSNSKANEIHHPTRILTWNLLAQCLIRRDLFPTSNCLKASQREQMLFNELLTPQADILCLQEVDRLEKILPALEKAGYTSHFAAGHHKKHGCLIAFKAERFDMMASQKIEYDYQPIRSSDVEHTRFGRSFTTKNIGSLVALRSKHNEDEGFIVATSHLFWHPKYTYERARQAGILLRQVLSFRSQLQLHRLPCLIAGDFNFAPDDPAYALLVGDSLSAAQVENLLPSYVVHTSVDSTVPKTFSTNEGDDEAADPDKVITSARQANESDGLLTVSELVDFFSDLPNLKSTYDRGLSATAQQHAVTTFGDRTSNAATRHGCYEPEYTSYTHYWKTTLDYIFVLDPPHQQSSILGLLAPPKRQEMEPGLPQQGITSSDHVSLVVDLNWNPV